MSTGHTKVRKYSPLKLGVRHLKGDKMQESTDGVDVVLTRGETELRALERWWRIFWWVHCWLTVSSVICSIVVLALGALMIYLPTDQQLKINIIIVLIIIEIRESESGRFRR